MECDRPKYGKVPTALGFSILYMVIKSYHGYEQNIPQHLHTVSNSKVAYIIIFNRQPILESLWYLSRSRA